MPDPGRRVARSRFLTFMRNDKYSSIRVGAALVAALVTGGAGAHKGRPYKLMSGGPGGAVAEAARWPMLRAAMGRLHRGGAAGPTPHRPTRTPHQPVTPSAARSLRCPTPAAGLHARDSSRSMRNDKYSSIRVGAALVAALVTGGAGAHKGRPYTAVCGRRSVPTTSTGSTRRGRAGDRTRSVGAEIQTCPSTARPVPH